jgi:hypothetical protein
MSDFLLGLLLGVVLALAAGALALWLGRINAGPKDAGTATAAPPERQGPTPLRERHR